MLILCKYQYNIEENFGLRNYYFCTLNLFFLHIMHKIKKLFSTNTCNKVLFCPVEVETLIGVCNNIQAGPEQEYVTYKYINFNKRNTYIYNIQFYANSCLQLLSKLYFWQLVILYFICCSSYHMIYNKHTTNEIHTPE